MNMNDLSPASGLPGRDPVDRLAEAVRGLQQEKSTSKMAGSFSAPVAYNHDQLFLNAQQQARQAARPMTQPMQFDNGARVQRMASSINKLSPEQTKRQEVHVNVERQQQAAPQRTRQRTQTPAPQPQPQPVPQPRLPIGQGGAVAGRVARDVVGGYPGRVEGPVAKDPYAGVYDKIARPPVASTTPSRGAMGSQFGDMVPRGYAPGGQTYGENPYQDVNNRVETLGWMAGTSQRIKDRAANAQNEDQWVETQGPAFDAMLNEAAHQADPDIYPSPSAGTELPGQDKQLGVPRRITTEPIPGTVLSGQMDKKPMSDEMRINGGELGEEV